MLMKDYYNEIDNALYEYEGFHPYPSKSIEWICNRIDWCWKWRKINKAQMENLTDRVCKYLEGDV